MSIADDAVWPPAVSEEGLDDTELAVEQREAYVPVEGSNDPTPVEEPEATPVEE